MEMNKVHLKLLLSGEELIHTRYPWQGRSRAVTDCVVDAITVSKFKLHLISKYTDCNCNTLDKGLQWS